MTVTLEHAQQMLEKGEKIEQEFAEYFTGERVTDCLTQDGMCDFCLSCFLLQPSSMGTPHQTYMVR